MRHLTLEKLPCSTQLNYFRQTIYLVVNTYPHIFSPGRGFGGIKEAVGRISLLSPLKGTQIWASNYNRKIYETLTIFFDGTLDRTCRAGANHETKFQKSTVIFFTKGSFGF